jgi:hypothetical protein
MAIAPPSPSIDPAREVLAGLVERVTFHNEARSNETLL